MKRRPSDKQGKKMRFSALISLVFLHCLGISGWPLLNIGLTADSALAASIDEMNERSHSYSLYRATDKAVSQIKRVDFNTYDLTLNFGIMETTCFKPLRVSLDRCQVKWGLSKPDRCSSYVRVSDGIISLRWMSCGVHVTSSSSEEI